MYLHSAAQFFCYEFILAMFAAYLPSTQQEPKSSMSAAVISILFLLNVCFKWLAPQITFPVDS